MRIYIVEPKILDCGITGRPTKVFLAFMQGVMAGAAQGDQVVQLRTSALGSRYPMVDLQELGVRAIRGLATVAVAAQDRPAHTR